MSIKTAVNKYSGMIYAKRFLLVLTLILILFPLIQKIFNPIVSAPLNGWFEPVQPPDFSRKSWFSGEFQQQYRLHIEDSIGFKADLVRLYNQADYSLFRIPHAHRIVVGKKETLFEDRYIESYTGRDFRSRKWIDDKISKLQYLQKYLWDSHKILLLVVIPPSKSIFWPERIPGRFMKKERMQPNLEYFLEKAKQKGIHHIDYNEMFLQRKDTSTFPLFPTTGIHWTDYGAWLAADSLFRYLSSTWNFVFPKMILDSLEISGKARNQENDINKAMNLIWEIKHPDYAYAHVRYESDSSLLKPSALFVGDSFYWEWYYQEFIKNMFRNVEFWYYDREIYPESFNLKKSTGVVNLAEAIPGYDLIVLFEVEAGGGNPGSGFIDRAYAEYFRDPSNEILRMEETIRNSPEWLESIKKKADDQGVPIDFLIRNDAIYALDQELLKSN